MPFTKVSRPASPDTLLWVSANPRLSFSSRLSRWPLGLPELSVAHPGLFHFAIPQFLDFILLVFLQEAPLEHSTSWKRWLTPTQQAFRPPTAFVPSLCRGQATYWSAWLPVCFHLPHSILRSTRVEIWSALPMAMFLVPSTVPGTQQMPKKHLLKE